MIRFLTNVFLIAFLADGSLSVADELISLFVDFNTLTLIRNYIAFFVLLGAVPLFIVVGLYARLPKIILFPLILFIFWCAFYAYPLPLVLAGKALTIPLSIMQLLMGVFAFISVKKLTEGSWLLTRESLNGPAFNARHTIAFGLINLLILPVLFVILLASFISAELDKMSGSFVRIATDGIYLSDKEYHKNNKVVRLVGMIHVGESGYYKDLYASILSSNTVVLKEGVSDKNGLLKSAIPHSEIARFFGLQKQPYLDLDLETAGSDDEIEFLLNQNAATSMPQAVIVDADIDIQEFSPETIEFLSNSSKLFSRTGSFLEGVMAYYLWDKANMTEEKQAIVINDIVGKRNKVLLQYLESSLILSDSIVIPWGAMHMPEIQAALLDKGFVPGKTRDRLAIEFFD